MGRYWLGFFAAMGSVASAGQPAQVPAPPPGVPPSPSSAASAPAAADGEFIEFLGADDVGDAAWWEFLKKSAPRKEQPPVPPQDAKQ